MHPLMREEYVCVSSDYLSPSHLICFSLSSVSACLSPKESCDQLMPAGDWKVWADLSVAVMSRLSSPPSSPLPFLIGVSLSLVFSPSIVLHLSFFVISSCSHTWVNSDACLSQQRKEKEEGGRWICNFTRLNITKMIITTLWKCYLSCVYEKYYQAKKTVRWSHYKVQYVFRPFICVVCMCACIQRHAG